jgi:methylmalonyl-CoA mutase N-terminal domain/subunit
MGGAVAAIEQGFYQDEIAQSAYEAQLAVERDEQIIVGVNKYAEGDVEVPELLRVGDEIREQQSERLAALRDRRDEAAWAASLDRIESAARGDENLMPHVLHAVEQYATVGEISHRLRSVWGEYGS